MRRDDDFFTNDYNDVSNGCHDILIEPECDTNLSKYEFMKCKGNARLALKHWKVQTLLRALSASQAPVDLICVKCDKNASHKAGYSPKYHRVWICGNKVKGYFDFKRTLIHELVHAFDFARAKIDTSNCEHVTCSEIRAINLSGECGFFAKQGIRWDRSKEQSAKEIFIRRQVFDSVIENPNCRNQKLVNDCISKVWQRCIRDTWPFDVQPEYDSKQRYIWNNTKEK
eukprot:GHVL01013563.1.p1 GENE.GHVL01013563.1~~GHVL01013563.1.p1  ORF type:complete len:227 (+),score=36.23 GHVL01013563.1:50-730(+)